MNTAAAQTTASTLNRIRKAYAAATGQWTGLDWTTDEEIQADEADRQRSRYADGDVGAETIAELDEALEAARGALEDLAAQVELAAEDAETHAANALAWAESGDLVTALAAAKEAEAIEASYGDAPTWRPFRLAIELAIARRAFVRSGVCA